MTFMETEDAFNDILKDINYQHFKTEKDIRDIESSKLVTVGSNVSIYKTNLDLDHAGSIIDVLKLRHKVLSDYVEKLKKD